MSYTEAMKSSNPDSVKVTRATVKGSITRSIKRLEVILVCTLDSGTEFDHETINKIETKELYDKLQKSSSIFQDLHDRYCEVRVKEVNQSEEKTVVQVEDDYVNELLDKICKLYKIYDRYHRSSVRFEQAKAEIDAIPFREEQLNTYKEEFKNATEVASRITAEEDKEMKPTEYVKAALTYSVRLQLILAIFVGKK